MSVTTWYLITQAEDDGVKALSTITSELLRFADFRTNIENDKREFLLKNVDLNVCNEDHESTGHQLLKLILWLTHQYESNSTRLLENLCQWGMYL
jgi:hypothetical protein